MTRPEAGDFERDVPDADAAAPQVVAQEAASPGVMPQETAAELGVDPDALAQLQATVGRRFEARSLFSGVDSRPSSAGVSSETAEQVQEITEDMLDLLRRTQAIEAAQAETLARCDRIEQALREGMHTQAREIDSLRRQLLGEHKAFAAQSTLEAMLPVIDKLRPMRAALNPRRQEALVNQLDAILEIVGGMLRTLGFETFEPQLGEPFDPERMRCTAQKNGPPGVVLGVEQPGYRVRATGAIVRVAGVALSAILAGTTASRTS